MRKSAGVPWEWRDKALSNRPRQTNRRGERDPYIEYVHLPYLVGGGAEHRGRDAFHRDLNQKLGEQRTGLLETQGQERQQRARTDKTR